MTAVLSNDDCVGIVRYVCWLEEQLDKESGCYSQAINEKIAEEYKKYEKSLDKIVKGQIH